MGKVIVTAILSYFVFMAWCGVRTYKNIVFGIRCEGHMKRAADANTIELATQEMETVVNYLEKEGMTSGYTSILYRTPNEDLGFLYQNMKMSLEELKKVGPETTQLEKSNILMKLRETLIDAGEHGLKVTVPAGIAVFPNNTAYAVWGLVGLLLAIFGCVIIFLKYDDWTY